MNEPEKIKMNLNIGDQAFSITVPFAKQDFVRDVEKDVDTLTRKWRHKFPGKKPEELMAMVAYQYASFYSELKLRYEEATRRALECLDLTQNDDGSPSPAQEPEPLSDF